MPEPMSIGAGIAAGSAILGSVYATVRLIINTNINRNGTKKKDEPVSEKVFQERKEAVNEQFRLLSHSLVSGLTQINSSIGEVKADIRSLYDRINEIKR